MNDSIDVWFSFSCVSVDICCGLHVCVCVHVERSATVHCMCTRKKGIKRKRREKMCCEKITIRSRAERERKRERKRDGGRWREMHFCYVQLVAERKTSARSLVQCVHKCILLYIFFLVFRKKEAMQSHRNYVYECRERDMLWCVRFWSGQSTVNPNVQSGEKEKKITKGRSKCINENEITTLLRHHASSVWIFWILNHFFFFVFFSSWCRKWLNLMKSLHIWWNFVRLLHSSIVFGQHQAQDK